jgi:hypothetical protein
MFVSEGARKVLLIVRGDNITKNMSSYLSRRVETKENIEILYQTEIRRMNGRRKLESVELENRHRCATHGGNAGGVFDDRRIAVHWLAPRRDRARRQRLHPHRRKSGAISAWQKMNRAPGPDGNEPIPACSPRATCAPVRSSVALLRWAKVAWRWQTSTALSLNTGLDRN